MAFKNYYTEYNFMEFKFTIENNKHRLLIVRLEPNGWRSDLDYPLLSQDQYIMMLQSFVDNHWKRVDSINNITRENTNLNYYTCGEKFSQVKEKLIKIGAKAVLTYEEKLKIKYGKNYNREGYFGIPDSQN